jgi:CspA family cold shock protein
MGFLNQFRTFGMSRGTVKFFNAAKGYGFIAPEDGGNDIFVHISAVERSGLGGLNDGDEVSFEIEQDRRSGKPAAVDLEVLGSSPGGRPAARPAPPGGGYARRDPAPRRDAGGGGGGGQPRQPMGAGSGVVKWFNATKGFGFIQPDGGGGDIFVHISDVERAGLRGLEDGQAVSYDVEQDRRTGKASATNIRTLS